MGGMKLKRINGRYLVKTKLSRRPSHDELIVADSASSSRLLLLNLCVEGRHESEGAFERYNRLRSVVCPPLIRPRELHRVLTLDGDRPEGEAWLYTRPYVAGKTLKDHLDELTPGMLLHYLEADHYLARAGHGLGGVGFDALIMESGAPRLRVCDIFEADEDALMENVAGMAEANAMAGGELSELSALIRDGKTTTPGQVMKYLTESFRLPPAAQFADSMPSRLQGYHRQLLAANGSFIRTSDEPPVVVIREALRMRADDMVRDLLARAEARGWFSISLGNAGTEALEPFLRRRVTERLEGWRLFSDSFSPSGGAAGMLAEVGAVHPVCLCMTLRRRHEDQIPALYEGLVRAGAGSSVALVIRLHSEVLPGRGELPGRTLSLTDRQRPDLQELMSAMLAADEVPPGLLVTLERYQVTEPEDVLPVLRYLIYRRILTRDGTEWAFSISRERAVRMMGASGVPLVSILRLEGLQRTALALLVHAGEPLGARMVAHTIDADPTETEEALRSMEEEGFTTSVRQRRKVYWSAAEGIPVELLLPQGEARRSWDRRLVRFALSHPSPGLSELLAAIGRARGEPEVRASLLYSAMNMAGEGRRNELIGRLLPEITELPAEALSASQMRRVLEVAEPRDISGLDTGRTREALSDWRQRLSEETGRTLAEVRLAELDMRDGAEQAAMLRIRSAVEDISAGAGGGLELALCLGVLADVDPGEQPDPDGLKMVEMALEAMPRRATPAERTVILSRAALALSVRGQQERADELVERAGGFAAAAGPDAGQIWEWCRGRVMLEQGKLKPAVEALERALLMAENRGDETAVAEILGLTVMCQERLPGYTLRSIAENMERICTGGSKASSSLYCYHSLSRLYGLYVRALRLDLAEDTAGRIDRVGAAPSDPAALGLQEWFEAFLDYQTGGEPGEGGDRVLPGTSGLLAALAEGTDPTPQARVVADAIADSGERDPITLGLYLAMETAARGHPRAAKLMASALTASYRPRMEEVIPAWRLCINALLAPRASEAEKALASAQIMARQLDRLLLVWLVLQVRLTLDMGERPRRNAEIRLLCEEIDRHLESQLSSDRAAAFRRLERISRRREHLFALGGSLPTSLPRYRDEVAESLRISDSIDLSALSGLPEETPRTSSVSWGLEALRAFSKASRIQVVSLLPEQTRVLESRGFGSEVPPSPEVLSAIRERGGKVTVLDSFAKTPFGSRFTHIIPLGRPPVQVGVPERRTEREKAVRGNFLIIEMDSPFDNLSGNMSKILRCFSRQIAASIALRELEEQTYFDSMTGAVIRGVWLARLREALDSDVAGGKNLAVLMIDLDYFKSVNDTFGHREGDQVLKAVVTAMKAALRPADVIGRLGGEEFGVLLPSASDRNAVMVAERVRKRVETNVTRPDRRPVTISVGVASAPTHGDSAELLVRRADVALYESKDSGRNCTTLWNSSMTSTFRAHEAASLLDTGDPGWDQLLANTVMQMLAAEALTAERAADELRNALRCEFLSLVLKEGEPKTVGPEEIGRAVESARRGSPGKPQEDMSGNWQYYTLGVKLASGGSLLAAWPADDSRPRSLPTLFASLSGLVEMLVSTGRIASE